MLCYAVLCYGVPRSVHPMPAAEALILDEVSNQCQAPIWRSHAMHCCAVLGSKLQSHDSKQQHALNHTGTRIVQMSGSK